MKSYVLKQPGEVIDGFRIDSVIGYSSNEPVYSTTCFDCGSSGVAIKHAEFRKGTAKCSSSTHFVATKEKLPVFSLPPQSEPEPETITVDQYVHGLRVARDDENKRYIAVARDQWCSYIRHGVAHGWNLDKMLDIQDWAKLPEEYRQGILDKQASQGILDKQASGHEKESSV